MKYYFGVYIDYYNYQTRIAEVTTCVDCLSCEMLANPGLITFNAFPTRPAILKAKELARKYNCKLLDIGWQNRDPIKIK